MRRDGSLITLQGSGVPVLDSTGTVVGFRGTRRIAPDHDAAAEDRERAEAASRRPSANARSRSPCSPSSTSHVAGGQVSRDWPGSATGGPLTSGSPRPTASAWASTWRSSRWATASPSCPTCPRTSSLSLNTSPRVLLHPGFRDTLSRPGLDLSRLVVEITEHELVTDYDAVNAVLTPLREHGMQVAVDDTGAGYASFTHVLRLRPDISQAGPVPALRAAPGPRPPRPGHCHRPARPRARRPPRRRRRRERRGAPGGHGPRC